MGRATGSYPVGSRIVAERTHQNFVVIEETAVGDFTVQSTSGETSNVFGDVCWDTGRSCKAAVRIRFSYISTNLVASC